MTFIAIRTCLLHLGLAEHWVFQTLQIILLHLISVDEFKIMKKWRAEYSIIYFSFFLCGICKKLEYLFFCPSYLHSNNEKDTFKHFLKNQGNNWVIHFPFSSAIFFCTLLQTDLALCPERMKGQFYSFYVENKHNGIEHYYIYYDLMPAGCEIENNISFYKKIH